MNDVTFGILVEQVNSGHIESYVDDVTSASGGTSRYTSGHGSFFSYQIEVDFSAHKFGNFNVTFDNGVGHVADGGSVVVDAFGTNTGNDFLTNVILESGVGSLFCRKRELEPKVMKRSSPFCSSTQLMKFI